MGRATLIKSVAQSTPIYTMVAFAIPKSLCETMDSLIRRFWWCPKKDSSHYFAPLSWESLCKPKKEGGLGFRKFWNFNLAMLSKFAWWILVGKESQCVKLLTAKYKVRRNQLSSSPRSNASWCWRSLEKVKAILLKGACWSIGDGRSVLVWEDPWVPECPNFRPLPLSEESLGRSWVVSYFFNQEGTDWDIHKL